MNRTKRVPRGICLILILTSLAIMEACSTPVNTEDVAPAYVSPYTWENLVVEDGRYYYYKEDECVSRVGIDVSAHQGEIEWSQVAEENLDFAIIRLGNRGYTEGAISLDEYYEANISGAKQAGLETGVYFFSQAINEEEAREEADFVLEHLGGLTLEYGVIYDHEPVSDEQGRANKVSRDQLTKNALAFCEQIEKAGYSTMIYGNKRDIARMDMTKLSSYPVWFAEYDSPNPTGQFDFEIWQYSNSGQIKGIATRVDMNIHFLEA